MNTKVTEENLSKLSHKDQVKFSLFCAKQVEHLIAAKETKTCIEIAERWLKDEASQEECRKAADDAYTAVVYAYAAYTAAAYVTRAAVYAAYTAANAAAVAPAAAYAAYTAANAAYDALAVKESNKAKITKEQEEYLYELINIDSIIEQNLLT